MQLPISWHNLWTSTKQLIRKGVRVAGYDLRRLPREDKEPPPMVDDPLEALYLSRGGKSVAFHCPLDRSVLFNGFSHAPGRWHPFSATLEEYRSGCCTSYEGSILERYYKLWQPRNAREALVGVPEAPAALADLPPYVVLYPWMAETVEERVEHQRYFAELESQERGVEGMTLKQGYKFQGPVHPRKGELEFARLVAIYESIAARGYDRREGDTLTLLIRRGDEIRFLDRRGHHRRAAMKALGYHTIPTRFKAVGRVDVADVGSWPQVRRGLWSAESARRYIGHLFDFDAKAWACERGLLPGQGSS